MKILEWKDKYTGKEMYDYHTGRFTSINNVFDTSTTGMSKYNDLIPGSEEAVYYRDKKNLISKIEYLTPQQYFDICAKDIFPNSSSDDLKAQRKADKGSLATIDTVIKNNVQLPMTVINLAEKQQEGLHRMFYLGESYGWNTIKFPVLIVNYYNIDLQTRLDNQKRINKITKDLEDAINEALSFKFNSYEDFVEELQWKINEHFSSYDKFDGVDDIPFVIENKNGDIEVSILDIDPISFDESYIQYKDIEDTESDDFNIDWDDIDVNSMSISDILRRLK